MPLMSNGDSELCALLSSQSAKEGRGKRPHRVQIMCHRVCVASALAVCVLCPGSCSSSAHCVVQDNTAAAAAVVQEAENILRTFSVHPKATVHTRITRNSIGSKAEQR